MEKQKCSYCGNCQTKKNGNTHYGKQNYYCHSCQRQFVENGADWFVPEWKKKIIHNLLKERVSLAGICRACGVSATWLYIYIDLVYAESPDDLNIVETPIEEQDYLDDRFDEEIQRFKKNRTKMSSF